MHAKFRLEILKEKDHLKEVGVDGNILLKWILQDSHGLG
jgi:hypothetical protein